MPKTETPRKGKPGPTSYSVMFPKNAANQKANSRARVAIGDKAVQATVDRDVAEQRRRQNSDGHN